MRIAGALGVLLAALGCGDGQARSPDGRLASADGNARDSGRAESAPAPADVSANPDAAAEVARAAAEANDTAPDVALSAAEAGLDGPSASEAEPARAFFVSPDEGDDAAAGTLASPLRTLAGARDAIRRMGAARTGPLTVYLRGGRHALGSTLVLETTDSGKPGAAITYAAYAAESPVVSGGRRITDWTLDAQGRWVATVPPGLRFRQLYVGGRRAQRARGPAPAVTGSWGPTEVWPEPPPAGYLTSDLRLAGWRNPADMEFGYYGVWSHRICPLAGIDRGDAGPLVITMQQPCFFFALHADGVDILPSQTPDYLENALELLDEPGEWYHDRTTATLTYAPRTGEAPATTEVIVPVLERLLEIRGTLAAPVHDLTFRGITFAHATWLRPSTEQGHVDIYANFTPDPDPAHAFWRNGQLVMVHNHDRKSPGAVQVQAGQSITFERCSFTQLGGGAGLDLESGSRGNRVVGSRFFDLSGSGIQVGDVLEADHHPSDARQIVKDNVIANNYLHDVGVEFQDSVAVWVGYTDGTVIEHNEVANLPYAGISVGWGWGEEDIGGGLLPQPFAYTTPTIAANNRIEHNHVHHIMQRRSDGGGVYTLGEQPNSIIRGNHVHDSPVAMGIYLDEGSGFLEVTENLVYRVDKPLYYNNLYLARNETCSVHDNLFAQQPDFDGGMPPAARAAGIEPAYQDILAK